MLTVIAPDKAKPVITKAYNAKTYLDRSQTSKSTTLVISLYSGDPSASIDLLKLDAEI